jgi:predicted MPP superfamily phosphohydrolase
MAQKAFSDICGILANYSFKDGIVGVVGNHEHWNSIELFMTAARQHPSLRILINESHRIGRGGTSLEILGVDDFLTGFPIKPPPRAPSPEHSARILISHNPDYVAMLLEEEKHSFDVALCGHTHGGQCGLPLLGPALAPVRDKAFIAGAYRYADRWIHVTRGIGNLYGLRLACRPEIALLTLA